MLNCCKTVCANSRVTGDHFSGSNQTNLALKGIIGIAAMANISSVMKNAGNDSTMYRVINFALITECLFRSHYLNYSEYIVIVYQTMGNQSDIIDWRSHFSSLWRSVLEWSDI